MAGARPFRASWVTVPARWISAALRGVWAGMLAVRALAGLLLVAYGAWLAWPPAGFIAVGAGLLADRILDERPTTEERDNP